MRDYFNADCRNAPRTDIYRPSKIDKTIKWSQIEKKQEIVRKEIENRLHLKTTKAVEAEGGEKTRGQPKEDDPVAYDAKNGILPWKATLDDKMFYI